MTERWARVEEHLKNAALYESPDAAAPGEAWKRRLLARRNGETIAVAAAGRSPGMQALLIVLPLVILILVLALSTWSIYEPSAGGDESGRGGWLRLSMQLLDIKLPVLKFWHLMAFGLGVTGLTFLVRGRLPNLPPMDW